MNLVKKRWCLLLLCLVSVSCVHTSSSQVRDAHIDKCLQYFTEISKIQDLRLSLNKAMNDLVKRYERGKGTKKELDMSRAIWHTTESGLRHRVTAIYDVAYAEKCFEMEEK